MFNIESYLAPYIGNYLGKYIENLNATQLQVSLWEGGATFTNVNLKLDAIRKELRLPFYLTSGRIHELKVSVPWTKLTSEPIVVNINSIELSISTNPVRHDRTTDENEDPLHQAASIEMRNEDAVRAKPIPPEAPSYMQSLINRVLHNIKFVYQNVVLKYVDRGLELCFGIRNVTLCSVGENWEQVFVELISPDFLLRQKLSCSDLTVCLDKIDSFGRVFMEPVVAKCSFDVRILSQFSNGAPGTPFFKRMDVLIHKIQMYAQDDQIPMMLFIYNSFMTLLSTQARPEFIDLVGMDESKEYVPEHQEEETEEEVTSTPPSGSTIVNWATWAVGLVPNALFGEVEEQEPDDDQPGSSGTGSSHTEMNPRKPVLHIAFHINVATVTFTGSECYSDRSASAASNTGSRRAAPYLRLHLQGVLADYIVRGRDTHYSFGISLFKVNGVGACPCGMSGCDKDQSSSDDITFLSFGTETPLELSDTLFDPDMHIRPSGREYDFKRTSREEDYPDETMLARTPGLAFDSVDILTPNLATTTSVGPSTSESTEALDANTIYRVGAFFWGTTRLLCAPVRVNLCSEYIHRIKRIFVYREFKPCLSQNPVPIARKNICHTYKIRMEKIDVYLYDNNSGMDVDSQNKIIAQFDGLKVESDVKFDCVLTKFQLHSLDIKTYTETNDGQSWTDGACMGILLNLTDEIQQRITVATPPRPLPSAEELKRSKPKPSPSPVRENSVAKLKDFFTFTYTQVPASNFQAKSGVSDPNEKFNSALEKYFGAPITEWHVPPDQGQYQFVSEFDMKMKSVDLVLTAETLNPFLSLFKELATLHSSGRPIPGQDIASHPLRIPNYNNNTLPLVYLETGRVRVFFKAESLALAPDTAVMQFDSAVISCQFENPLHRSILRTDLFQLAQDANITCVPGSPIEDRQYQLELNALSISTCMWDDIEYNSPQQEYAVIALPLLEHLNVSSCFSPAIVYERFPTEKFQRQLIGGHAFELNIASEINIVANVRQINLLRGLTKELLAMSATWSMVRLSSKINFHSGPRPMERELDPCPSESSSVREADSGIESGTATGTGTVGSVEYGRWKMDDIPTRRYMDIIPIDVFLAAPLIRITTYDMFRQNENTDRSVEQDLDSVMGILPLVQVIFGQPYFVRAVSPSTQRLELSFYDLSVSFGPFVPRVGRGFTIPGADYFPDKLFETIEGERDLRTGIIPPFFICQASDFAQWPCESRAEIVWPVKINMCKKQIDLLVSVYNRLLDISIGEAQGRTEAPRPAVYISPLRKMVRLGCHYIATLRLTCKQVVFTINEEPPGLANAAIEFSASGLKICAMNLLANSRMPISETGLEVNVLVTLDVDSFVVRTILGDRKDIVINPWDLHITVCTEWHTWITIPLSSVSLRADPVSVFFGPHNILAFLQIHHSFGNCIQRFIEAEEEEILEILDANPFSDKTSRTFTNDMLSGIMLYLMAPSCTDLPRPYQIVFCPEHGTMTWRYPEARSLTRVDTLAFPLLHRDYLHTTEDVELRCAVEYWDNCQNKFLHFKTITISVEHGHRYEIDQNNPEPTISCIWRVALRTSLSEETKRIIFLPSFLPVFQIDSLYNPKHIQKLKAFVDIPRLTLHLVNHMTFGGKLPEERLRMYTSAGLSQLDQPFATLEFSRATCDLNIWWHKAILNGSSFARLSVIDYAYLTDVNVIDPFEIQLKYNLRENDRKQVFSGFTLLTKPITVKVGGSTLHTAISSTISWMQTLKAYYGHKVDTSKNHFQSHLNMTQIVFCNHTASKLAIIQFETKQPQVICSRKYFAFNWTTQKVKPECCVGLYEANKWVYSRSFPLNRCGTIARQIGIKMIFIKIERLYASQRLITVSGAFTFANATDKAIEVGFLNFDKGKERKWILESRSHGPSDVVNEFAVGQFRFRLFDPSGNIHGWSNPLAVADLRNARNKSKCIGLYRIHEGELIIYNVWCSLIEEAVLCHEIPTNRCIIVVSPLFRARSSLAVPMSGKVATARGENFVKFVLSGRGEGTEIDYLGPHDVVHHLTFQPSTSEPPSSPSIPLLPNGPALEDTVATRPIDDILHDIMTFNSKDSTEPVWPYTGDGFQSEQWSLGTLTDTTFDATYSPWIEGLPAVLVDVKPWGLFVNLTGSMIFFQESCQCKKPCQQCTEVHPTVNRSAFSPATKRGEFYIGIENEKFERYWSGKIGITDEASRSDVHNINSNWKIPLDCFSRLDVPGNNEMFHLTIETAFHNGIFLLIIRPTFKIQNLTQLSLSAKGFSLNRDQVPDDKVLALQENVLQLDPNDDKGTNDDYCLGLLTFNCDWNPDLKVHNKYGMKYIGIRYQKGPFWFVQLMKFESIFDNLAAPKGVSVKRVAVSIPNCQPQWVSGTKGNLQEVQIPLSVCWTCRNGQIWISISIDNAPQVIIHNESRTQIMYAEGNDSEWEARNIPQYHCLGPCTLGFYTLPSLQRRFPEIIYSFQNTTPTLLLGRCCTGVEVMYKKVRRYHMLCRSAAQIQWSNPLRLDCADVVQTIQVGQGVEQVDLRVHIEKLGLVYYVYIEEPSLNEVSAKDIRTRITDLSLNKPANSADSKLSSSKALVHQADPRRTVHFNETPQVAYFSPGEVLHVLTEDELKLEMKETRKSLPSAISKSPSELAISIGTNEHPYLQSYFVFPEIHFILTDDFTHPEQKREIISITLHEIYIKRQHVTGDKRLRCLMFRPAETWQLNVHVGDIQIDNALYQEKRYDFPVLMKSEYEYRNFANLPTYTCSTIPSLFENSNIENHRFVLVFEGEFSLYPSSTEKLFRVDVQCQPITVNVEDQFLDFIYPAVAEFTNIITERIPQIKREHAIIQEQQDPSRRICPPTYEDNDGMEVYMEAPDYSASVRSLMDPSLGSSQSSIFLASRRISISSSLSLEPGPSQRSRRVSLRSSNDNNTDSLRDEQFGGSVPDLRSQLNISPTPENPQNLGSAQNSRRNSLPSSTSKLDSNRPDLSPDEVDPSDLLFMEELSKRAKYLRIPKEIVDAISDLAHPILMDRIHFNDVTFYVTLRMSKYIYLAIDHSPLCIHEFDSNYVATTHFTIGDTIAKHFITSAVYKAGNPVRLIGSLELLGSPGSLFRSYGTGVKDFVVYPLKGIARGPLGFLTGFNYGFVSLVRHVGAGTLTSFTNLAWSVSRNIDRLTLTTEEQQRTEEERRVPIDGVADGLAQGLTSFGVRLLGAIGGLAQHPLEAATGPRASTLGVVAGISRGIFGFVAKPIGATADLVAKTGQGLLTGAGWTPNYQRKYAVYVDDVLSSGNSFLKYSWKLGLGDERVLTESEKEAKKEKEEKILLVVDAMEERGKGRNAQLTPVSLVITTEHVYIMDTLFDQVKRKDPIGSTTIKPTDFLLDPGSMTEFFNVLKLAQSIKGSHFFDTL